MCLRMLVLAALALLVGEEVVAQPAMSREGIAGGRSGGLVDRGGPTLGTELPGAGTPGAPLTAGAAAIARARMQAFFDYQARLAAAPMQRLGTLSDEHDWVERPPGSPSDRPPSNLAPLQAHPGASKELSDPGLAEATRLTLRARLGRDPTAEEVGAELRAFDERVARAGGAATGAAPRIGGAIGPRGTSSGERSALRPAPIVPETAAASEGFRRIFQIILSGDTGI